MKKVSKLLLIVFNSSLFFYALAFALLECLVRFEIVPVSLVPRPSDVLFLFYNEAEVLLPALFKTASISALAFMLSSLAAFLLALIVHEFVFLQKRVMPLTLFFQTVPIVAIAPLLVIYLGFGLPTILSAALIVCFFPVLAATLVGLTQVSKSQAELFQFLKANAWQRLFYLEIPSAVPLILAGLKTSAGLSVVGVVSGEFVAGGGLGALIDSARLQQRVDIVFACLVCLSLIGLTLMSATESIFKLLFKAYFAKI